MTRRISGTVTLVLLVLVAIVGTVRAEDRLDTIFDRANAAYFRGDHREAAAGYELLLETGLRDPDVHFNLATAYARLGKYGRAILHFERTLHLRAGDEAAAAGLAAAQAALGSRRAERKGEATVETRPPFLEAFFRPVSTGSLAWALLILNLLFFGALIVRSRSHSESVRLGLGIAAPLLGILVLVAASGLTVRTGLFREGVAAVVIEEEVPLREGPDRRAVSRGTALEGEKARLLENHSGFARVRLSGDRQGWMPSAAVQPITPLTN